MRKHLLIATFLAVGCVVGSSARSKVDLGGRAALRASKNGVVAVKEDGNNVSIKRVKANEVTPMRGAWVKLHDGFDASHIEMDGVEIKFQFGNTVMASVTDAAIDALNANEAVASIKIEQSVKPKMDRVRALSGIDRIHDGTGLPQPYTGAGVIAGIVDGGFDPNHVNFKNEDGTSRIQNFCYFRRGSNGYNQENYGPEYMPQIDTETSSTFHGTHTLGIMAGGYRGKVKAGQLVQNPENPQYAIPQVSEIDNPWYGVAYGSDISIACGAETDMLMAYGIADILNFGSYMAGVNDKVTPVVINLSLGTNVGPHDGTSTISQFMDYIIEEAEDSVPVSIVIAAGNEGDLPISVHKTFSEGDNELKVGFKSLGLVDHLQDENGAYYKNAVLGSVYIYSDTAEPFEEVQAIIVNRSRGRETIRVALPIEEALESEEGAALYYVSDPGYAYAETDQVNLQLAKYFNGYVGVGGMIDTYESGRFYSVVDIFLYNTELNDDAYIAGLYVKGKSGQRVDVFTSGDYFNLDDQGLGSYGFVGGDTDGTISDLATGKHVISVGAYNCRDHWTSVDGKIYMYDKFDNNLVSDYSSYGTLIDGRKLPHVCAPGSTVISSSNEYYIEDYKVGENALQGVLDQDNRRYSWHQCVGTSMAAPVVSGSIALWYEANPDLTNEEIIDIVTSTARVDDDVRAGDPVRWGAGKFDAYAGLKEALRRNAGVDNACVDTDARPLFRHVSEDAIEVMLSGAAHMDVTVYDLSGRLVAKTSASGDTAIVNVGALSSGIYLLKVNNASAIKITL